MCHYNLKFIKQEATMKLSLRNIATYILNIGILLTVGSLALIFAYPVVDGISSLFTEQDNKQAMFYGFTQVAKAIEPTWRAELFLIGLQVSALGIVSNVAVFLMSPKGDTASRNHSN